VRSFEEAAGRVMVALDYPSAEDASGLLRQLKGIPCYVKVGMQLFYAEGPRFVAKLKEEGYRVFLDLKLHDIPNTVMGAAHSITRLGVDMFNVHAAGGIGMMEAALEGVERALSEKGASPIVIGVTQLTSTSAKVLNEEIGIPASVEQSVLHYAENARKAGLQGVVASPLEVAAIKRSCGADFITVTPGIRPHGTAVGDQARVTTPQEAFGLGTDYIVVGRPITMSQDPRRTLESLIEELLA
jgi:orotidine-5'-phosphate decarboxylase